MNLQLVKLAQFWAIGSKAVELTPQWAGIWVGSSWTSGSRKEKGQFDPPPSLRRGQISLKLTQGSPAIYSPQASTTQDRVPANQREGQPGWLAGDVVFFFVLCTMPQKNILLMCN